MNDSPSDSDKLAFFLKHAITPSNKSVYSPPYDSPIEDAFAFNIVKYLEKGVELIPQYEVITSRGKFILDFILKTPNKEIIAIECDGREYHDFFRDAFRDAFILKENDIDEIIRFTGKYINYYFEACLFFMLKYHPELFSLKGLINIETLAEMKKVTIPFPDYNIDKKFGAEDVRIHCLKVNYEESYVEDPFQSILVIRRVKDGFQGWQRFYDFAIENSHIKNIDDLVKTYEENTREKWSN
jgi:hypothetical protein